MTTLRHAWEIVPPRTHMFPVLKAFVDRIVGSAGGSWEKRDRLLLVGTSTIENEASFRKTRTIERTPASGGHFDDWKMKPVSVGLGR
jgi:hypothetical protein